MDSSTRTKVISKNALLSLIVKGGQIVISLLLVRLLLQYLGNYEYGLWITISSVLAWMNMFNLGLGHGMRNKVAESIAQNNLTAAQSYISTTYILLSGISLFIILLFIPAYLFVDWNQFFNVQSATSTSVATIVLVIFVSIAIQFVVGLIRTVLSAIHKIALAEALILCANLLIAIGIAFNLNSDSKSLLTVAILYAASPIIILILSSLWLYISQQQLAPKFSKIEKQKVSDVLSIGLKFFGLQIAVLILFSTDNYIIAKLFSPAEVTPYNIAYKYFGVITVLFTTVASPFWSGVTDAYMKSDFSWISNSIKKLLTLLALLIPIIILMVVVSNPIYQLWIGEEINIPILLSITFGVYVFIGAWNSVFSMVINGIGKLNLAFYIAIFGAIINIPLSIFLARNMNMGISGVAWATIICQLISAIIIPIQVKKLINSKAIGIWKA